MKILLASAECTPIIKVGGLADVVGALPKALRQAGHDVRIVIPKYDQIDAARFPSTPRWTNLTVPWNGQSLLVHIDEGRLPGTSIPVYYIDCPAMFHPGQMLHRLQTVYANSGDPELLRQELQRFIFFSIAVATTLPHWEWRPELLHVQDWHTALIPALKRLPEFASLPKTLLTIHNLPNQGRWNAKEALSWFTAAPKAFPERDGNGDLNLLQLGILSADGVNTVSPTYAKEILSPEYAAGLEKELRSVRGGVAGILNGIDGDVFNPATDAALSVRFDQTTLQVGKAQNRRTLYRNMGIQADDAAALIVSVGRLTSQKGYQLLPTLADWLQQQPAQLIILGTGTPDVEAELQDLVKRCPNVHLQIGFDDVLARQLYASGDLFLMPSQFEPCGLGQMLAMRYGTLPIVRATGGLQDSVTDLTVQPEHGTGFVFSEFTATALQAALHRGIEFVGNQRQLRSAQSRAMAQDFSWQRSSQDYIKLYAKILKQK